jgi:hypothetical protein
MATITYTVTVATGTNQYGTGNKFYINGTVSPTLQLEEGNIYIFDQSDATNAAGGGHPFRFSITPNGTHATAIGGAAGVEYTNGVTATGTPGNAGAQVQIIVGNTTTTADQTVPPLFYYCSNHTGMGGSAPTLTKSSGLTNKFNPPIDDIIEEAFERTNIRGTRTGYQLRSARRSLNIMFQEWENRGVHLWKVKLAEVPLILGQAEYSYSTDSVNFPNDMSDMLEAFYRNNTTTTNPQDIALTQISRSQYNATPNKLVQSTPSQFYVERKINPSVFLYATPSSSVSSTTTPTSHQFCFYYLSKIENPGAYTNVSDVVNRFYPCMMSGLAYYLSMKFSPERTPELERIYESELLRALDADNQGTSTFISPQTFYGDGVMS